MCTVAVSLEPAAALPLLVLAIRDEVLDRPWAPPAEHWPRHPGIIGGLDLQAGGTWLAADPVTRRVGCVLNGDGPIPPAAGRRSRGELPLAAVAGTPLPGDLSGFSPFHLLTLDPSTGGRLSSWDGRELSETPLPTGVTVVGNDGLSGRHPRVAWFLPLITGAARPDPQPGMPSGTAWASWLDVLSGQDAAPDDRRALIHRRVSGDGIAYGSGSVTLIAASRDRLRYDFAALGTPPLPLTGLARVHP